MRDRSDNRHKKRDSLDRKFILCQAASEPVKRCILRVGEQQKHDKYDAVEQHWGVKELESSLICVHSSRNNTGATVDYTGRQNDLLDIFT